MTITVADVMANLRVGVPTGYWSLMSTGKAYQRIGRKPKEGAKTNTTPTFTVSLEFRPVEYLGDPEEQTFSNDELQTVLENGRTNLEFAIWADDSGRITAEQLANVFFQCMKFGASLDELKKIEIEDVELVSKDGERKVSVPDLRNWFKLTEGKVIKASVSKTDSGYSNVERKTVNTD